MLTPAAPAELRANMPEVPAEEVANVVAFLASDAASYVNGQSLFVDGGVR